MVQNVRCLGMGIPYVLVSELHYLGPLCVLLAVIAAEIQTSSFELISAQTLRSHDWSDW